MAPPNRWRDYLAGHADYMLTTEGELIDLRPYRRPKRSNAYPLKGVEFNGTGTPVTARIPRKETMTYYTDKQIEDALVEATRDRGGYLEIDTSVGDADFGTYGYWKTKGLDEVNDVRAIIAALDKIDERNGNTLTWEPVDSIRKVKDGERYRVEFNEYAYEGVMNADILTGHAFAATIGQARYQYSELLHSINAGCKIFHAKITPPNPYRHEFIIDKDTNVWRANRSKTTYHRHGAARAPEAFGNNWQPAKVVVDK